MGERDSEKNPLLILRGEGFKKANPSGKTKPSPPSGERVG
jgi:hypothetical protein